MKFLWLAILLALVADECSAWQSPASQRIPKPPDTSDLIQRRSFLTSASTFAITSLLPLPSNSADVSNLTFNTSPTGLQYADVKVGSGSSPSPGSVVSIDYVMSTTGARYGSKIYSTVDAGAPYRWKLGDGSTIPGLEEAVSTMSPGGIRRVIIPSKLAFRANSGSIVEECQDGKGLGPRPSIADAVGEFQRFKNIYCELFYDVDADFK
jgi:hypothetical protein